MATSTLSFCSICFILVKILFLNEVQSENLINNNGTNSDSSWKLGRIKRSLANEMPKELRIEVEYETDDKRLFVFRRTKQNLANNNLPVDAPLDYLHRNTIMDDIGEFVMYQDVTTVSAFVYFGKTKTIFGVIDNNYYVRDFPLEYNDVGFVTRILKFPYLAKPEKVISEFTPNNNPVNYREQPTEPKAGPSNIQEYVDETTDDNINENSNANTCRIDKVDKRVTRIIEHYLETLVFISRSVVKIFYNAFKEDYINRIVTYYITYFNAVNIFLKQLQNHDIKIRINIAKIIIEDDLLSPFEFLNPCQNKYTDIMLKLPKYLKEHSSEYPPDSFDHIFIITYLPIMLDNTTPSRALTKPPDDLLLGRAGNKFYDAVSFTIIKAENYYSGYFRAYEEIAKVFTSNTDPEYHGTPEGNQHILNEFKKFFSENPNRVFLRNRPRSLLPPGRPILISPQSHCRCFGHDLYKVLPSGKSARTVREKQCAGLLKCQKEGSTVEIAIPLWPFDGTPCGRFKVCWEMTCQKII